MNAKELYKKLDDDFKVNEIGAEDWDLDTVKDYVTDSFIKRNEGIMYDFSQTIEKVYTMTFPDTVLIEQIIEKGEYDVLIFAHHAQSWVSEERAGESYVTMENLPVETIEKMKERRISLYSLHIPLDNYQDYSTGKCFAEALDIKVNKGCSPYLKAITGVIGTTSYNTISALQKKIEDVLGHRIAVYSYGSQMIEWGLTIKSFKHCIIRSLNNGIIEL